MTARSTTEASTQPHRARINLAVVAIAALGTIVAIDLGVRAALGSPVHLGEVSDAVSAYTGSDPDVVVIGSSHARSFDSVATLLARRTGGTEHVLPVPLEGGKLSGYHWVLKHRLAPLMDERNADGSLRRQRLRQVILVTEWWDSCSYDDGGLNIPGRAWYFGDFVNNATEYGLTPYNRSYIASRWARDLRSLGLVRNRILAWIPGAIRMQYYPPDRREAYFAGATEHWQELIARGRECLGAPEEMAALDSMLAFLTERKVATTILLYPIKPGALTPEARAGTLAEFSSRVQALAARYPDIRIVDLSESSPLRDEDWGPDFDHLTPDGNRRFAAYVLDGPLAFLAANPRGDSGS